MKFTFRIDIQTLNEDDPVPNEDILSEDMDTLRYELRMWMREKLRGSEPALFCEVIREGAETEAVFQK